MKITEIALNSIPREFYDKDTKEVGFAVVQ